METRRRSRSKQTTRRKKRVFSLSDYRANDGMITASWGPAAWHLLHMISFNYPVKPTQEQKCQYRDFILSLRHVLPCKYCRMNLVTNFKQLPLKMSDMENRDTFSRYVYDLHELVNKMLKKKSNLSYCDVRERYEHFRARCTEENPKIFKYRKYTRRRKEKGCTEPLYGKKSKCVIQIVPQETKTPTFQMDEQCKKKKDSES
jgi:hypothetical protein